MVLIQFRQVRNLGIYLWKRIGPRMNGMDLSDGSGPDPFAYAPDGIAGMALIAELGHDLVFAGGAHQGADLIDVMRQGFLAIDMFATPHCLHRDDGMGVI